MSKSGANDGKRGKTTGPGWAWSLGGSLVASLCCAGPAVAVLLGLGGASFLLGLSRYRIPLLLLGLGFAVLGVVRALRRSRQACSLEQHRRNLWLIPGVTLATFAVTYGLLTYAFPTAVYNSLTPAAARQKGDQAPGSAVSAPAQDLTVPDTVNAATAAGSAKQQGRQSDHQPAEAQGQVTPEPAAAELPSSASAQPITGQVSSPAEPEPAAGPRRVTLAISGMT